MGAAHSATDRRRPDRPALRPRRHRLDQPRARAGGGRARKRSWPSSPGASPPPASQVDVWEPRPHRPNFVATLPGHGAPRHRAPVRRAHGGAPPCAPSLMLVSHLDVVGAAARAVHAPGAQRPPLRARQQRHEGRPGGRGRDRRRAPRRRGGAQPAAGRRCAATCSWPAAPTRSGRASAPRPSLRATTPTPPSCPSAPTSTSRSSTAASPGSSSKATASRRPAPSPRRASTPSPCWGPCSTASPLSTASSTAGRTRSYGRGSIHAATIAGGTQLPAYPGLCRLSIERCLIAGESVDQSRAEIEALLAAARAADPRFAADSRLVVGREPVSLRRDDPVVLALVAAAAERARPRAVVRGDIGWADSGIFAEAGIPCAQFGPIGDGEHTAGEWVDVESVKLVARVLEARRAALLRLSRARVRRGPAAAPFGSAVMGYLTHDPRRHARFLEHADGRLPPAGARRAAHGAAARDRRALRLCARPRGHRRRLRQGVEALRQGLVQEGAHADRPPSRRPSCCAPCASGCPSEARARRS